MKTCKTCQEEKEESEFTPRYSICKLCNNRRQRELKRYNAELVWKLHPDKPLSTYFKKK